MWSRIDRTRTVTLTAAAVLTLAACAHDATGPQPPLNQLPRSLTVNEVRVRDGSNRFAFGLLREESRTSVRQNTFLSPLSASYALGMATTGAANATLDSMRSVLGLDGLSIDDLGQSYQSLTTLLLGLDSSVDIRIANGIWYKRGFSVEPAFISGAQRYFSATVQPGDFDAGTASSINTWADRATNGKITHVVDGFDPSEVMLIANAIYFKGSWTNRFDAAKTAPLPFSLSDGGTVQLPMMRNDEVDASYYGDASMQAVDLPYGRGAYAMTILLPPRGTDIEKFVANLDGSTWARVIGGTHPGKVSIALPKFQLAWSDSLNATLRALGMSNAYCNSGADFSGVSRTAGPFLCISDVQQKTFIDVNEEGTEAAAVTTVGVGETSLPSVPTVIVDHPFVLAIRERLSGTILFLGKITRPPQ